MKTHWLVISVIALGMASTTWADDLPAMGHPSAIPIKELIAKGYRWVTVNGPYACATEQKVRNVTSGRTELTEQQMLEDGGAYYLIPGTLVRVVEDDHPNGMSEILLGGITRPLWTYTKFLSARPIHDIYGIVETPETAGLLDPGDSAVGRSALNERAPGGTP